MDSFKIDDAQLLNIVYFVILLAGAFFFLIRSRIKLSEIISNLLLWFGIFAVMLVGYSYKNELSAVWQRVYGNIVPGAVTQLQPYEVQVHENQAGQYYVNAYVQGQKVKFLVDTGASNVLLTWEDASSLIGDPKQLEFTTKVSTANGFAYAAPVIIHSITIGDIEVNDVSALVAQQGAVQISLLGMTYLGKLDSYEIRQNILTLRGYRN
jgi:aspartyl protease family protein